MLPSTLPLIPLGRPALKVYTGNDFCLLPWVSSDCKSVSLRSSLSRVPAKDAFIKEGGTRQYSLLCCELAWTWKAVVSMTTLGLEKQGVSTQFSESFEREASAWLEETRLSPFCGTRERTKTTKRIKSAVCPVLPTLPVMNGHVPF